MLLQIQFLPFHSLFITWTQRLALVADLGLIWWLSRKILSGREEASRRAWGSRARATVGAALSAVAVLFSWAIAIFPGEWQQKVNLPPFNALASLHDWVFNSDVDKVTRRRLLFSSTLVLPGFNIYEGLGVDDPDKAKWHDVA